MDVVTKHNNALTYSTAFHWLTSNQSRISVHSSFQSDKINKYDHQYINVCEVGPAIKVSHIHPPTYLCMCGGDLFVLVQADSLLPEQLPCGSAHLEDVVAILLHI